MPHEEEEGRGSEETSESADEEEGEETDGDSEVSTLEASEEQEEPPPPPRAPPDAWPNSCTIRREWAWRRKGSTNAWSGDGTPPSVIAKLPGEKDRPCRREEERQHLSRVSVESEEAASHLVRETALPQTAYLRFRTAEDNRQHADVGRAEREALLTLKEERAASWIAQGRAQVNEGLLRQKRSRRLRNELVRRRNHQARELRVETEVKEQELAERQEQVRDEMRKRVLEASALDARLDEVEDNAAEEVRKEATRSRAELAKAAADVRERHQAKRRDAVKELRGLAERAHCEMSGSLEAIARQRGQEKREEARQLSLARSKMEMDYLGRARFNRERAMSTRERARAAMAEAHEERRKAASKERSHSVLIIDEKVRTREVRILAAHKREVCNIYQARFASRAAAAEYERSPLKDVYHGRARCKGRGSASTNGRDAVAV